MKGGVRDLDTGPSGAGEAVGSCCSHTLVGSKAKAGAGPGNKLGCLGRGTPLDLASASGFSTSDPSA